MKRVIAFEHEAKKKRSKFFDEKKRKRERERFPSLLLKQKSFLPLRREKLKRNLVTMVRFLGLRTTSF